MFAYSDPTETDSLLKLKALEHYRQLVHAWYRQMARLPNSAFTLLDAFTETHANTTVSRVSWIAFPKMCPVPMRTLIGNDSNSRKNTLNGMYRANQTATSEELRLRPNSLSTMRHWPGLALLHWLMELRRPSPK